MKKFVFTNERYLHIKNDEYEALKSKVQNVDKQIEIVNNDLRALELRFHEESVSYNSDCASGVRVDQLRTYQWFFPFLLEEQKKQLIRLQQLEDQIKNSATPPSYLWEDVELTIGKIQSLQSQVMGIYSKLSP